MKTWEIIFLILWFIVMVLSVWGQHFINQRHSKKIKELEEVKEYLRISMDDHWVLIKHLLDKEKAEKQGPKSPDLWNEVKRNEKL